MSGAAKLARREQRERVFKRDGFRCWYCGDSVALSEPESGIAASGGVDHLIPSSRGGDDSDENLVACCYSCNSRKATSTREEYRQRLYAAHPLGRAVIALREAVDDREPAEATVLHLMLDWLVRRAPAVLFFGEAGEHCT